MSQPLEDAPRRERRSDERQQAAVGTGTQVGTWARLLDASGPGAILLVRLALGTVFVSEGIQKFLYPDALGVGRFVKIGIPAPELLAPFVGTVEIVCGTLVALGAFTRLAALPLIAVMLVAIVSTKVPILLGRGWLGFAAPAGNSGLWSMLHEARTDLSMLLCSLFLLRAGAGTRSLDARLQRSEPNR